MTGYLTPDGYGAGELTEKRSRFLSQLWPVTGEEEARARIEETRKKYHDARHNCWCFLLRDGTMRYGDDGEPQGTAGQPMLNVFRGRELVDLCCVVTRYFGGILLGTGGLVRAYSTAASLALADAGIRRMALWQSVLIACPYPLYERVRRLLLEHEAVIEDCDFGADTVFTALLRCDRAPAFHTALRELTSASVSAEVIEEVFRGVRIE